MTVLNEGSRAKYVNSGADQYHQLNRKAKKADAYADSAASEKVAQKGREVANNARQKASSIRAEREPLTTCADNGYCPSTYDELEADRAKAKIWKDKYTDRDVDRLAQRKPGTFIKEESDDERSYKIKKANQKYNSNYEDEDEKAMHDRYIVDQERYRNEPSYDDMDIDFKNKPKLSTYDKLKKANQKYTTDRDEDKYAEDIPDYNDVPSYYKLKESRRARKMEKAALTEALDHEARRYGYKNYAEYRSCNK